MTTRFFTPTITRAPFDFLDLLFASAERGTLFISGGRRRGEDDKIHPWRDTPYDLARVPLERIAADAIHRGRWEETYYSCALYAGTRRVEAQAVLYWILYADLDYGRIPPSVPLPTVTLLSSPEKRQAVWRLHKPADRETATDLNRRLAHACGADLSGWDATQVLRLPGLPNHKYTDVFTAIEQASGRTYDREDFGELPHIPYTAPASLDLRGDADGMAAWRAVFPHLSAKMRGVAMGDACAYRGDQSAADHALMCALCGEGLTPDEAVAAFLITPRGKNLGIRKGEGRLGYLTQLSVRKAVAHVGTVVSA